MLVNGTLMTSDGNRKAKLYQKINCTSTGVPRKNQMYSVDSQFSTGLCESFMTASTTPKTSPSTVASTEIIRVTQMPSMILGKNRYSATFSQRMLGLVASV